MAPDDLIAAKRNPRLALKSPFFMVQTRTYGVVIGVNTGC
jgi:hypothetical protein